MGADTVNILGNCNYREAKKEEERRDRKGREERKGGENVCVILMVS